MVFAALLPHRGVLRISGKDRSAFLQGLITNDVRKITPYQSVYAALLSPQGKFQYDLMMADRSETWLVDCDRDRAEALLKRLSLYKLRLEVMVENLSDTWIVGALWGEEILKVINFPNQKGATQPYGEGSLFVDPRLENLGLRVILPKEALEDFCKIKGIILGPLENYDLHRLTLGVPDGSRDIPVDRGIPLECGLDELQGIDWDKGCYMGQELTARTRYRGLVRKRLLPVRIKGKSPSFHAPIFQEGKEVGDMRTSVKDCGLAMIRLEALSKSEPFQCEGATLIPSIPPWVQLPSLSQESRDHV